MIAITDEHTQDPQKDDQVVTVEATRYFYGSSDSETGMVELDPIAIYYSEKAIKRHDPLRCGPWTETRDPLPGEHLRDQVKLWATVPMCIDPKAKGLKLVDDKDGEKVYEMLITYYLLINGPTVSFGYSCMEESGKRKRPFDGEFYTSAACQMGNILCQQLLI